MALQIFLSLCIIKLVNIMVCQRVDTFFPKFQKIKEKPPVEGGWRAHDSAIVSVEYVKHDTGEYILTASTDRTARLWTLRDGHFVGTFGQV